MKRIARMLALLLCAVLLLSLCACGGGKPAETPDAAPKLELTDKEEAQPEPEEAPEEAPETAEALKGVAVAKDWEGANFVIDLPAGFHYDEGWSCYTNNDGVQIWAEDMDLYEYDHNFEDVLETHGVSGDGKSAGLFRYWTHEAQEFYGPSTHYDVSFEGRYGDFYGCHLLVSVGEGKDIALTQSQDIIDMLSTIRRDGETVGDQGTPPAAESAPAEEPEPTEEPVEEPEETEPPYTPLYDLWFNYSGAECAEMSTYMNFGHYDTEGNTLVGLGFSPEGEPLLVAMELQREGEAVEIADYRILDKAESCYVNICGDYVYYIRDWAAICRVPLSGGDVDVLEPHTNAYLQLRGEHMYYCNADYIFQCADLDGKNAETVLDKEIYFPWMLDEEWLLYQDDADGESLHLYNLPSGEDFKLTDDAAYNTYLYNTDLFVKLVRDDTPYLAKIDLINPEIAYDEETQEFSYSFPMEVGTNPIFSEVCFTADGFIYVNLVDPTFVDDWEEAVNEDGNIDLFFAYTGEFWDVYCEIEDGLISSIWLVDRAGGPDVVFPYFE